MMLGKQSTASTSLPSRINVAVIDNPITTVYSCIFKMLTNGVVKNSTLVCHSIELYLLCSEEKLGNNNWLVISNIITPPTPSRS